METMNDYTCLCTGEQTRRAYELGAPMELSDRLCSWSQHSILVSEHNEPIFVRIPTTQQMLGWIEGQVNEIEIIHVSDDYGNGWCYTIFDKGWCNVAFDRNFNSRKQAELAAIDAALSYLERRL